MMIRKRWCNDGAPKWLLVMSKVIFSFHRTVVHVWWRMAYGVFNVRRSTYRDNGTECYMRWSCILVYRQVTLLHVPSCDVIPFPIFTLSPSSLSLYSLGTSYCLHQARSNPFIPSCTLPLYLFINNLVHCSMVSSGDVTVCPIVRSDEKIS